MGRFTCDGRKFTRMQLIKYRIIKTVKKSLLASLILVIGGWLITAGILVAKATIEPEVAYAERIVEVPVKEIPPIMKKIAKCESNDTHFKNGQVLMVSNTNKSVDIGRYQINTIHAQTASKLGLDLTLEKDNETFAMHLYETQGTEPWYSSRHCWNK
jgi:hypothetical protein